MAVSPKRTDDQAPGGDPKFGRQLRGIVARALEEVATSLNARQCEAPGEAVQQQVFRLLVAGLVLGGAPSAVGLSAQLNASLPPVFEASLAPSELLNEREHDLLLTAAASLSSLGPQPVGQALGAVHELLLEYQLERLRHDALCFKPERVWVELRRLADTAKDERLTLLRKCAGISSATARQLGGALACAHGEQGIATALNRWQCGHAAAGTWVVQPSLARRRSGSHFTPPALAELVVERCLQPLTRGPNALAPLDIRLCDPAMGAGVFLSQAAQFLAQMLLERKAAGSKQEALHQVIRTCLLGVDVDPRATLIAQLNLFALCGRISPDAELAVSDVLQQRLITADALRGGAEQLKSGRDEGFDAVLGNPPWVAYVGRAAQPLSPSLADDYKQRFASFGGYRTLQGLFVEQSARLLRPGGRLGLVLPTSMADLAGYAPTRAAHDTLAIPDPELPDFGDNAFDGVFQPCMALLSTRLPSPRTVPAQAWELARRDLSQQQRELMQRLGRLALMPGELFGERGYQTRPHDRAQLQPIDGDLPPGHRPLRTGTEIAEFELRPPRLQVDPERLQTHLKPPEAWQDVRLFVRQTARFPIATLADGLAFRNSIIAGFESPDHSCFQLLGWLNSSAIRWFHYFSQRDARQGMPQLKVAHLRALPAPPPLHSSCGAELERLGRELGERNQGISVQERALLDELVSTALKLDKADRQLVSDWAERNPPPQPRALAKRP